MAINIKYR